MKKTFLLLLMTLVMSMGSLKAQADYIIVMDNSGSITNQSFDQMKVSAKKLIESILLCSPKNRVAVVHYGTGIHNAANPTLIPRIYIESDFTSDIAVAQNFSRKLNVGDHLHEALGLIGNALDHVNNTSIVSPQKTLTRDGKFFKIIVFTDASRGGGDLTSGSYLVNYNNPTYGYPDAFKNVTLFKKFREAKFTMIHVAQDSYSREAAASIASQGGYYSGPVESNVDDPDYGALPRMYFEKMDFNLTDDEIAQITQNVCESYTGLRFWFERSGCGLLQGGGTQGIHGNFVIPPGGSFIEFKLSIKNIVTGEEYPVDINATVIGNDFYTVAPGIPTSAFHIPSNISGKYIFVLQMVFEVGGNYYTSSSLNNWTFFGYDIDFDCTYTKTASTTQTVKKKITVEKHENYTVDRNADPNHYRKKINTEKSEKFHITPNPVNDRVKIILKKDIESGIIQITDMNGNEIYEDSFRKQKEITIDMSTQKQGLYLIRITSGNNETYSGKIIKN